MKKIFFYLSLFYFLSSHAQIENWQIVPPLDPVTSLSGNYAELRRNHFHGGLDFRTGGVENQAIFAIDEGYIAKIHIAPRGYGKLVYINHPNGYTSLYAHLNGFVPKLDSIVKSKQYAQQTFEIEISFQPDEYPVKRGEQFALSGNTGSSGGPHLHFEIRKTDDYTLQNPMVLNKYFEIKDTRSPRILGIKIYGIDGYGKINDRKEQKYRVITTKNKTRTLQGGGNITAWGKLGFSVKANDYMTGTGFTHNPRILKLYVDNKLISDIEINNIKFSDSRALNSFIDYKQWAKTGEFFMKSFPDTNSPLKTMYKDSLYNGIFVINEEKTYQIRYEVYDDFGLKDVITFSIQGKVSELNESEEKCDTHFPCKKNHIYENEDFLIHFPQNALYSDISTNYQKTPSSKFYSHIHEIGDNTIPLHTFCDLSIKIGNDTIKDKQKYFIAKLNNNNIITGSAGGSCINGFMVGKTNAFGKFAVAADLNKPIVTAINTNNLTRKPYLRFKIFDGLSGIDRYDGYIDNEWILFEYDAKTNTITYRMDKTRIERNKTHKFKLIVTDKCGNSTTYSKNIYW